MLSYRFNVPVMMQDGVELSAIIALPEEKGRFPSVLVRTPYNAQGMFSLLRVVAPLFEMAWVLQDTRGRYNSGGEAFIPMGEREDTLDTIAWMRRQSWCNGDIHVFGPSYLGYVGLQVLGEADIKTLFAPMTFSSPEDGLVYRSGVLQLHWALPWSIMTSTRVQAPLANVNGEWPAAYRQTLPEAVRNLGWPDHVWKMFLTTADDAMWKGFEAVSEDPVRTRVLLIGGWYDFMLGSALSTYQTLSWKGGSKPDLIIGPWSHNGYLQSQEGLGDFDFGDEGKSNVVADFAELLKREREKSPQLIKAFIMRGNRWVNLSSWPPHDIVEKRLYIGVDGTLNEESTKGGPREMGFEVDPANPVPTLGGSVWEFKETLTPGPTDQRPLRDRDDILRFYTQPFRESTSLLGPLSAHLWVGIEVPEAHFTAKLVLVKKADRENIVQDGIIAVKGPSAAYALAVIDMLATGIEVRRGERLGLEVSWTNFPKYALPPIKEPTRQSIRTSEDMPSYLSISILPGEA